MAVTRKNEVQNSERTQLLRQAVSTANALGTERASRLSFDSSDRTKPEYQQLSAQLTAYAETIGLRNLYIIAQIKDQLVMGPGGNLSPGTPLQNPSSAKTAAFRTGQPKCIGPKNDDGGKYLEAVVPITGPGKMAICMEIDADDWNHRITQTIAFPLLITILPPGLVLLVWHMYRRKTKFSEVTATSLRNIQVATWCATLLLLTAILTLYAYNKDQEKQRDLFLTQASIKSVNYAKAFNDLQTALHLTLRFMESSEEVTPKEFSSFCQSLLAKNPDQATFWLPALSSADINEFTEQIKEQIDPEFSIRYFSEDIKSNEERSIYPAVYIEPATVRATLLGYDFNSNPELRKSIEEAAETGLTSTAILTKSPDLSFNLFILEKLVHPRHTGMVGISVDMDQMTDHLCAQSADAIPGISTTIFSLTPGTSPLGMGCSE
ncbi:MAG: CHASE domain-containing protein, partial [Spirochaetales bacterium]|nr:CHASE domain-containing protein [Spirochaetales bacterium]